MPNKKEIDIVYEILGAEHDTYAKKSARREAMRSISMARNFELQLFVEKKGVTRP
jgi:hypothetical protein